MFCGLLTPQAVVITSAIIYNNLQRGEVLISYETLYFQPRKNPRNICDVTSSKPCSSGMLHGKNNFSAISQLRLVRSHNTNLRVVAQGAFELYVLQFGKCNFLSDPCVFGCIF